MAADLRLRQILAALLASLCVTVLSYQAAAHALAESDTITQPTPIASETTAPPAPLPMPSPTAPPPTAAVDKPAGAPQPVPSSPTPAASLFATINQTEGKEFPLVAAYVSVADDSGNPVPGLGPANFEILEDGKPTNRPTVTTTVNSSEPLAVALVLDISGSMEGKSLDYAKQSADVFLDMLQPQDVVELVSFSTYVKVNIPFTTTKPLIARGIENLRAGGDTALYDAIATALQTMTQSGTSRKVVVLLTDGEDTDSRTRVVDVQNLAATRRVPIFTVGLGNGVDRKTLDSIAKPSGGSVIYATTPLELPRAFDALANQLRSQYDVRFASNLQADGQEHKLLVRVTRGTAVAEGQGSFVAQKNPPWLDIVSPNPGQVVDSSMLIKVSAQPNSPAAKITKVDVAIDDKQVASSSTPPYEGTISVDDVAPGEHVLKVTAHDSAGNTASNEVSFNKSTPASGVRRPTATRPAPPSPTPLSTVPSNASTFPIVPVMAGTTLLLAASAMTGFAVSKRRRQQPTTCRNCGTIYSGRETCPTCALQERNLLVNRLHDIIGTPSGDQPTDEREDKERP